MLGQTSARQPTAAVLIWSRRAGNVTACLLVVVVVVVAPLLFDARFSEYAAVENTGLRGEREDQDGLELGAGNPCFRGFD